MNLNIVAVESNFHKINAIGGTCQGLMFFDAEDTEGTVKLELFFEESKELAIADSQKPEPIGVRVISFTVPTSAIRNLNDYELGSAEATRAIDHWVFVARSNLQDKGASYVNRVAGLWDGIYREAVIIFIPG